MCFCYDFYSNLKGFERKGGVIVFCLLNVFGLLKFKNYYCLWNVIIWYGSCVDLLEIFGRKKKLLDLK